jgi:hypothetical protein
MPFTNTSGVDNTFPTNSDTATVDDHLRDIKTAYNERLDSVFGTTWKTQDPLVLTKLGDVLAIQSKQVKATAQSLGNLGATPTINWNNGPVVKGNVNVSITSITFSNPVADTAYTLVLTTTGGTAITWPASIRWNNNGSAPTLVYTNGRVTVVTLYYTGSVYLASLYGTGFNVS